jgi:inositol-1,3,4-trisphosphate 5/6-kinase / inositol-tetrakisphosphate 1-kinase
MNICFYVTPEKYRKLRWEPFERMSCAQFTVTRVMQLRDVMDEQYDMCVLKLDKFDDLVEIEQYFQTHPKVVVRDPIAVQRLLSHRDEVMKILIQVDVKLRSVIPIKCPLSKHINAHNVRLDMDFPVICKKDSHVMYLALSSEALAKLEPPYVVQEYINHNSVLYKVNVIGTHVFVKERHSLPNLTKNSITTELLPFDNKLSIADQTEEWPTMPDGVENRGHKPRQEQFEQISQVLRELLGASLFGYDVIREVDSDRLAIIDINYFPTYAGCVTQSQFFECIAS